MKLDEKILAYFESCNSPVDKQGYLYKKGEIKTSYQKRWFVLKGNLLFYKDSASDRDLIGVIVLEGCTVQLCESEEQFAFSVVWSEPGLRTYKFAAEDQASQESWIKALLSANHEYLSLLLMDLEKKYRDALAAFPREQGNPFTMPNFRTPGTDFSGAYRSRQLSTLPSYAAPAAAGAAAASALSNSATLHTSSYPTKSAVKRSPNQRPRRNINAVPFDVPDMPMGDWSSFYVDTDDDFSKLHEDFGKEVKELIVLWSKRKRDGRVVQEEDLIDFG